MEAAERAYGLRWGWTVRMTHGAFVSFIDWLSPYPEAIGFWAAVLTTGAFAPQVVRTWRSGADGLSWITLGLFGVGVALWFIYGVLRMSGPVMLANALTELQVLAIFVLKVARSHKAGRPTGPADH